MLTVAGTGVGEHSTRGLLFHMRVARRDQVVCLRPRGWEEASLEGSLAGSVLLRRVRRWQDVRGGVVRASASATYAVLVLGRRGEDVRVAVDAQLL